MSAVHLSANYRRNRTAQSEGFDTRCRAAAWLTGRRKKEGEARQGRARSLREHGGSQSREPYPSLTRFKV
jgi:hypothetical protein